MVIIDTSIEVKNINNGNQYSFQCMSGNESKLPTNVAAGSTCEVYGGSGLEKILNFIQGNWVEM